MSLSRKRQVERAFSAAAPSYDRAAHVQREVAARMAAWIRETPPPPDGAVLEIGCGTGLLTERLVQDLPGRRLWATDLSPAMVARCRARVGEGPRLHFQVMDGERPDLGAQRFDRIVSSLAFQWFDDLPGALTRLRGLLAPGGRLQFATMGRDTFHEWRRTLAELGLEVAPSPFPTLDDLAPLATVREERIVAAFADGAAFLRHLRELGATVPAPGARPLPPGALRRAAARFTGRATYHVLYGEVRAP